MSHRRQQLRINARQPRQSSRIQAVVFLAALPDQSHVTRMRHDGLVPQFAQPPADPRRMHPGFERNAAARHTAKHLAHRFRSRTQPLFQQHVAGFI
ncbi:MAG: hypothetical protein WBL63_16195 [Candidatus Acidiferrum sp.]